MQIALPVRWLFLTVLLAVLFLLNLSLGTVDIPLDEIFRILIGRESSNEIWEEIIWDFRMTKALTCLLAGSALALGGLQMQTLFRNPLAGPDVLGLSSGASLAVSLVFMSSTAGFQLFPVQSAWTVAIAASLGCVAVFAIMLAFARRLQDNASLLIVGLMIGAGTSSIVSVLQFLSSADEMQVYIIWTFGSLGGLNWTEILVLSIVVFVGLILCFFNIKSLNAWLLGDNYAYSMGINLSRARLLIILSASIFTGAVTAFCGPIAFVGLAVPHLVKIVLKTHDHKQLLPGVFVGGASLLLACDIIAQLPYSTSVLPINAITALIGAPVIIWIILRAKIVR